jgi:hypothetical protein
MDVINVTNSPSEIYTGIGTIANLARHGLEFYARGEWTDDTKQLITQGIDLCALLQKGATARQQARVSLDQLHALEQAEPLLSAPGGATGSLDAELKEAREILLRVLNHINGQGEQVRPAEVERVAALFARVGELFVSQAFAALNHVHDQQRELSSARR